MYYIFLNLPAPSLPGHQLKPVRALPNPAIPETCWRVLVDFRSTVKRMGTTWCL